MVSIGSVSIRWRLIEGDNIHSRKAQFVRPVACASSHFYNGPKLAENCQHRRARKNVRVALRKDRQRRPGIGRIIKL